MEGGGRAIMNSLLMRHACLAVVIGIIALAANGTTVRRMSLEDIRDSATAVIVADVIDSTTRFGATGMPWTDYHVRIAEILRGRGNAGEIRTLSFAGGGPLDAGIAGVPRLTAGSRYLIFLDDTPGRPVPAVGWGQGIFRVLSDRVISVDGAQLVIGQDQALHRLRDNTSSHMGRSRRRLAEPIARNADGSVALLLPRRKAAALASSRGATLDDLRDFIRRTDQ